ncbi:MAG: YitT family protein [Flavobacteriaceae bacterium]|nr:YitT family protein [Flavobacteriaceae bacterium]
MSVHFNHLLLKKILHQVEKSKTDGKISSYKQGKRAYELKIIIDRLLKDSFLIVLGVLSAGFGLKGFLLPNNFIDGGVTGISLLTSFITGISLSILIIAINIPFLYMGYRQIGKNFAIKSAVGIVLLALAILFIEYPVITSDKLLVAVFGGFFLGLGIGFSIRGGSVLDGTEVLAIYLNKKTGLTIGDIILLFNILIFSFAAYLLSVETALYSILTYLSASKTIDFVVEGIEEYTSITVVSTHSDEIRLMIIEKMKKGVTIYSGKRGFGRKGENLNQTDIIFTVVTRLEIGKIQTEIKKIDPNAFIVMSNIKETHGGMIKKRPLK